MSMNDYQNISIIDVATRLGIQVKKNKALCFVHDEKTPSLSFNDRKGVYFCHGCGIKGNVPTLVSTILKLDTKATYEWLSVNFLGSHSNYTLRPKPIIHKLPKVKTSSQDECLSDPEIYNWLIEKTVLSNDAKSYLVNSRGFSEEVVKKLEIRDIQNPYEFFKQLEKAWGSERLLKCGLLKKDDTGKIKPIWWDHVIVFPFINLDKKIIYLQARRLKTDNNIKYINLKGVKKGIFNINCIGEMKPGEKLFICEGIPDTITMIELGHKAIGILGANSFNDKDINRLLDYNIHIVPDSDSAGQGMARKIIDSFKRVGKIVTRVELPKGKKDINELHISNNRN